MFTTVAPSIYQAPRCFVTYGTMGHVDTKQKPHKGKPWAAIKSLDFIHKVDLIMPMEVYKAVHEKIIKTRQPPQYAKVTMTLGDILEGEFFIEHIKNGNILMLSEGRTTTGTPFTLREGILSMYLDKETYERAGLVGKPYGAKGGRGLKPRWLVSFDLRSPAMSRGKRGFDRLVYACKNVFNQPTTWLFCNVGESISSSDPLQKHSPTKFISSPEISPDLVALQGHLDISAEILGSSDRSGFEEAATECYEWLSLIRLGSPRVQPRDNIDPYLSRYQVPGEEVAEVTICKLSWQGLMSSSWLHELLIQTIVACPSGAWFSLAATCFSRSVPGSADEVAILRPPAAEGKYLMWETKNTE
ncbi:ribonuclease P 40kDa subunit [Thelonectria olida]|uniref:Ribonuclease P 40kDa subunit n=1 Tax=Thelonectria olida TaxID=1576542 RepID=A0A9P8VW75_9HYPO|nr:ribonuclease P 40kDa subunit [Thelonectria olida]